MARQVVDVPARLSACVRVFETANARKSGPVDAHAVAAAALRSPKLNVSASTRNWSHCGYWPIAVTSFRAAGAEREPTP
jgi:hypothetical protein